MSLELYEACRAVPDNAKKTITGGRLNGKTDINPMWRIKMLTELFGPAGFGWRYEIVRFWTEPGSDGIVSAFCQINLYVKHGSEWSTPIPGIGGSAFVDKERSGMYTNDECYKMALTDALSVSCKSLGMGADVYWEKDTTKYTPQKEAPPATPNPVPAEKTPSAANTNTISKDQAKRIYALSKGNADICRTVIKKYGYDKSEDIKKTDYDAICSEIEKMAGAA